MSFWSRRYVNIKKKRHPVQSIQFFSVLKSYKTVLVHPVMEPGREVFSLHTVEDIVEKKGANNVELLLDEKLAFFFKNLAAKKILYEEFTSPFSSSYKEFRKQLSRKEFDVYVDMNRFSEEKMTLFGSAITSKVQMCIDGARENPVFNMVITSEGSSTETERSELFLNPLGIKRRKKHLKWKKPLARRKHKKALAIAIDNERLGMEWYTFLRRKGFDPVFFVSDNRKVTKLKQKSGVNAMGIYPLERSYESCTACSSFIVSVNPIFSMAYLLKRKTLLMPSQKGKIIMPDDHTVEIFSFEKGENSAHKRIKTFVENA